jgi:hypothetical protein
MCAYPASPLSEAAVVCLWQQQMQWQRRLLDSEGEPIEVVYPGRPNDGSGGDFRDAVVVSNRNSRTGCIEVHTDVRGWQDHGHQHDAAYNQVVLHVAWQSAAGSIGPTVLQNGQIIPTVILSRPESRIVESGFTAGGLPCQHTARQSLSRRLELLDQAGDCRLTIRAAEYRRDLVYTAPGECLYRGFLEALGYSKNKLPFRSLACQVTLETLAAVSSSRDSARSLLGLQAFLCGKAGLLPSQRGIPGIKDNWVNSLEETWSAWSTPPALSARDWELYKVRPVNFPVRRIAALSYLLERDLRKDWPMVLLEHLRRAPDPRSWRELETGLIVAAGGYWSHHYDFGTARFEDNPVLLGQPRAREIIINVILPFALAWCEINRDAALSVRVREIYRNYPKLEANSIERHLLRQLVLNSRQINSARRQQGLLHIFKTGCSQGKCQECSLANE